MALYGYCQRCDREPRRVGGVLPQVHVVGDGVYCHDCVGLSMAQKGMKGAYAGRQRAEARQRRLLSGLAGAAFSPKRSSAALRRVFDGGASGSAAGPAVVEE